MQPKYYGAVADYNRKGGGLRFDRRLVVMILGGLGLIIVLVIGFSLLNAATAGPKDDYTTLVARMASLQSFLTTNDQQISNDSLLKITSEAALFISTDKQALSAQLSKSFGVSAIPDSVTKAEADTSTAALTNAAAAGNYDSTFLGLFRDKIAATETLATKVLDASSTNEKIPVSQAIATLKTIDQELSGVQL